MKNLLQFNQKQKKHKMPYLKQSMALGWLNFYKLLLSKQSFNIGNYQEGLKKRIGHRFGLNPFLIASKRDESNYLIKVVVL